MSQLSRRTFSKSIALAGMGLILPGKSWANQSPLLMRQIPSSGERIPVVGMGSWLTFDVGSSESRKVNMGAVLSRFHQLGGRVIDSSPMYGSSEQVIGELAQELGIVNDLWVSTKIWTNGRESGQRQIERSNTYFSEQVRVHHVHNIRDFEVHYKTLRTLKDKGALQYIGVTHYLNGYHSELARLIRIYELDFIQVNFNVGNPHAQDKLLPIAQDNQVAVIVNRPFAGGQLFDRVKGVSLPGWALEKGIENWPEYFLKFILSHSAVTCAIPATTQVRHVEQNMAAGHNVDLTTLERQKLADHFAAL